ncbi:MAG: hypothetical protein HY543_12045 [Deltaproteobacteria bacterium]|nr:hypothetical protein [Deltaproteobacteria bacterium]
MQAIFDLRAIRVVLAIIVVGCVGIAHVGCGSSSSSDSGSSGSSGGGSGGSGSGDSGGGSTSGFAVSGTLASLTVSSSTNKGSTSGTATHVMAVSPETGSITCKKAAVESSGAFSIGLTGFKPWFLFFLDKTKTGSQMFLGQFKTSTLDTLLPGSDTGSLTLGTVTIDGASGTASATKDHASLVSELGVDSETAETVGKIDDFASRYQNPDMDGDGSLDCDDSGKKFMLDFHVRFDMKISGTKAKISDLIDSYLSETATTASYSSTGVYLAYPSMFASAETGSVTFGSAVKTDEGGTIAADTPTSSVTNNNFTDYKSFGPNLSGTSELPSGTIKFAVGSKTITFADVKTPSLADLQAPTGRIFPFIKFNKSDTSCQANCTLASVNYKWMKKTSSGWSQASVKELKFVVADGTVSFRADNSSSRTIQFAIPKSANEGTITWSAGNATLTGVTTSEFDALTTTQICHLGLSYDDQLGMRYFQNIDDATGTCS